MANGTTKLSIAQADRLREKNEAWQRENASAEKLTDNAVDQLPPYRDEQDSETELSVNRQGIHLKAPLGDTAKNALVIGLVLALVIATAGWVAVQVMRAG